MRTWGVLMIIAGILALIDGILDFLVAQTFTGATSGALIILVAVCLIGFGTMAIGFEGVTWQLKKILEKLSPQTNMDSEKEVTKLM